MNGFQARTDHAHYLMIAVANQFRQRLSDVFLVISDQDAHMSKWRSFHAKAPAAGKMGVGRWERLKAERRVEFLLHFATARRVSACHPEAFGVGGLRVERRRSCFR